ncbi:MAG: glycosyltransferase family 2 protein [Arachidicoccus sp.]|nr:glycosyltransferase family 2 protein [Arachidicoccus sp.]
MSKSSVAVVILNYNGRNYLKKFLPFVLASAYSNSETIVADNASTDDSVTYLQQNFPSVRIISLEKNFGFAEGYNQALKQVNADYFVLLNSDVEVTPNWIEPVIDLMQKDKSVAFAQPKILSYNNKEIFEYAGAAGGFMDFLGYPFARGRIFDTIEKDNNQYKTSTEIFWASGAALFAKAKVFNELDGFYGFLFAHQEEIDLCWRAQRAGYKIACCAESVVYHVGGGTLPKGHFRKTFLNFRNNLIMLSRNLPFSEKLWKIPLRLILDGVFAFKSFFSGDFVTVKGILLAHFAFYKWRLTNRSKNVLHITAITKLKGVYKRAIIIDYFLKRKKYFSDL